MVKAEIKDIKNIIIENFGNLMSNMLNICINTHVIIITANDIALIFFIFYLPIAALSKYITISSMTIN